MKIKCIQCKYSEFLSLPFEKEEFSTSSDNDFYRLVDTRFFLRVKYIVKSDDRMKRYRNCLMRLKEKETSHLQRKADIIYNENLKESIGIFYFKAHVYNYFPWGAEYVHMYECICLLYSMGKIQKYHLT